MFQFAAALALAKKHSAKLALDVSSFLVDEKRSYELFKFPNLNHDHRHFTPNNLLNKISDRITYDRFEEDFHSSNYDKRFESLSDRTILDGYWQCEKYFMQIEEELRKKFSLNECKKESFVRLSDEIKKTPSVSLHFRRGDYVESERKKDKHNLLEMSYYDHAIKKIVESSKDNLFWIFSDDPQWVKENFKLNIETRVIDSKEGLNSTEELTLMSYCRHNIIANSSFSWWAGWLNNNVGKIVIYPQQWFRQGLGVNDCRIPSSWLGI